jgi:tRNA (adenine57-N1/adenine58-N1)-methyltransferase
VVAFFEITFIAKHRKWAVGSLVMAQIKAESPFLVRSERTQKGSVAILSLKRDQQMPIYLRDSSQEIADPIANTRFGSYPHSTLLDKSWGSQVIATNVNATETRKGKKRKRADNGDNSKEENFESSAPAYEAASRGFAHILPPTPEMWTVSLPHRTQVVYTPDYSFILQKLQARPGDTIIEAGAGSGSFTHASARAVFSGYPPSGDLNQTNGHVGSRRTRRGKVCSFEYHEPRAKQLQQEVEDHDLEGVVIVTHRDVYEKGFLLENDVSPEADVIFLDLPEPRRALEHLVRLPPGGTASALNSKSAARVCTFSPCIEQVQQTVEALQRLGWVEISTFEIQHKRLDVRRDLVSLNYEGLRGVNASAANVDEAVAKLKELDAKITQFHESSAKQDQSSGPKAGKKGAKATDASIETKKERLDRIKQEDKDRKVWREGKLVHKTEPELKTHTSYLTFAMLPQAWSQEDEAKAMEKWFNAKAA